jgi:hypothetical protein
LQPERKASADIDGLSFPRRCPQRVAFVSWLSVSRTCRIGPKDDRSRERITKPSEPGQFVITEICLCRRFAICGGRVHFVKWCATSFYSFRSREFQKHELSSETRCGAGFQIPRERREVAVSENRTDAHDFGRFWERIRPGESSSGDAYAPPKASALLTFLKRSMRTALICEIRRALPKSESPPVSRLRICAQHGICVVAAVSSQPKGFLGGGDTAATTLNAQRTSQLRRGYSVAPWRPRGRASISLP